VSATRVGREPTATLNVLAPELVTKQLASANATLCSDGEATGAKFPDVQDMTDMIAPDMENASARLVPASATPDGAVWLVMNLTAPETLTATVAAVVTQQNLRMSLA